MMTTLSLIMLTAVIFLMIIAVGLLSSIRENTEPANLVNILEERLGATDDWHRDAKRKPTPLALKNYTLEAVQEYCKQFSYSGIAMSCSLNPSNGDITVTAYTRMHGDVTRTQDITGMLVEDLNCQGQPAATDFAYRIVSETRECIAHVRDIREERFHNLVVPSPTIAEDAKKQLAKKGTCPTCGRSKRKVDY